MSLVEKRELNGGDSFAWSLSSRFVADEVGIVARTKVNQEFTFDLRQQLFAAIMRQVGVSLSSSSRQ